MVIVILDVSAGAPAGQQTLFAFQRTVGIVFRTRAKSIRANLFFFAKMSAFSAIILVRLNIGTNVIADEQALFRTGIDA